MKTLIPFRTHDHGSFEDEWGLHAKSSEWWYATGYLHDDNNNLYSFQYTLVHTKLFGLANVYLLMLALTDFTTKKHYYSQCSSFSANRVAITDHEASWVGKAGVAKGPEGMKLTANDEKFSYDLMLDYGKGAFWHCNYGVLQMGIQDKNEVTLYYSYTNMPTVGTITLGDKTLTVTGRSWFDKQGGPYNIMNTRTHWEWFSLRFYDNEEVMLFSFPQSNYQDGTYITREGESSRLNDYTIKPHGFTTVNGVKFSVGWDITTPGLKDESYTVTPIIDGQLNLAYFEQLARITNSKGEEVGLCFVELLPGVLNKRINPFNMLKKR